MLGLLQNIEAIDDTTKLKMIIEWLGSYLNQQDIVDILNERIKEIFSFSADSFIANSYHHQSVKELGEGYKAMAFSDDGLIEAIYMPDHRFAVGVQWHPEKKFENGDDSWRILIDFVESCKK